MTTSEQLRAKLDTLPTKPGCYLYHDANGKIIYVGKAVNLRNRVRSYFRHGGLGKTAELVRHIADLECIVVGFRARGPDPRDEPDQKAPAEVQHPAQG